MLHAVILAGGSGTRFWPLSRRGRPKQLLPVLGTRSLLRQTVERIAGWIPRERTWIVATEELQRPTRDELPEIPPSQILVEPAPRGTAAAIGLAAARLLQCDSDATMLILPADHFIEPADEFRRTVEAGESLVESTPEALVLIGISPTSPATGYGYIERAPVASTSAPASPVVSFREKPNRAAAEDFLRSGRFVWNAGIFLWRCDRILHWLRKLLPETAAVVTSLVKGTPPHDEAGRYEALPIESIDRGILERADQRFVLPASFRWDDLGTWAALERHLPRDAAGNVSRGNIVAIETGGCLIQATDDHLVATSGVEDLIIVQTPYATLVARKGDEEGLKDLIRKIEEAGYGRFL